jgi:pSer/pThr/pTyr-binding forkhead associated (FHA) protein
MADRPAETRAVAARVAKTLKDRARVDEAIAVLAAAAAAHGNDAPGQELMAEVLRLAPTAPIAKQAFERMEGIGGDHKELDAAIAKWTLEELQALEKNLRPAFRKAQLGFNNNVKHLSKVFHVQTEDSGLDKPHIITHLFADGGRIIKSHKRSYASEASRDDVGDYVKSLMKGQHMEMVLMLREGRFDGVINGTAHGSGMDTLDHLPRVDLGKVGREKGERTSVNIEKKAEPAAAAQAPDSKQPHLFTLHVLRSLSGGPDRYEPRGSEIVIGSSGAISLHGELFCHPTEAVIFLDRGDLILEDIDGGNGVFVRIRTRVELADGDEFIVGDQLLRLQRNPEVDDGPGPGPTYFFSSPKGHASFRIAQILEGGCEGSVCLARHNALQVGSVVDEHFFNDMILRGDPLVAPYHCVVEEQADSFILSDLGARSGVFVRIVGRYKLQHGDELLVGRTRLLADLSPIDKSLQPLG